MSVHNDETRTQSVKQGRSDLLAPSVEPPSVERPQGNNYEPKQRREDGDLRDMHRPHCAKWQSTWGEVVGWRNATTVMRGPYLHLYQQLLRQYLGNLADVASSRHSLQSLHGCLESPISDPLKGYRRRYGQGVEVGKGKERGVHQVVRNGRFAEPPGGFGYLPCKPA
jgi:hypothetical protein